MRMMKVADKRQKAANKEILLRKDEDTSKNRRSNNKGQGEG